MGEGAARSLCSPPHRAHVGGKVFAAFALGPTLNLEQAEEHLCDAAVSSHTLPSRSEGLN